MMKELQHRQIIIAEGVTIKFVNAWFNIMQTSVKILLGGHNDRHDRKH